jgi:hypothetical protein
MIFILLTSTSFLGGSTFSEAEDFSCFGSTDQFTLTLKRQGVVYDPYYAPYGQEYDIEIDMDSSEPCGNNTYYEVVGSFGVTLTSTTVVANCGDGVLSGVIIDQSNWYVDIAPLPLGIGEMSTPCLDDFQHIGTIL